MAPTLLIQAADPMPGIETADWHATWSSYDALVQLPGTHFTLLDDHVDATAQAVEQWLTRHAGRTRTRTRRRGLFKLT